MNMNNVRVTLKSSLLLLLILPGLAASSEAGGSPDNWPREIVIANGVIVIYQPQPETLEDNLLKFRAAVGVEIEGNDPVFGAVWFEARLETDRSERTALITDLKVVDVRFPSQDPTKLKGLSDLLETAIPRSDLPIEMDELIATLELAETQARTSQTINTDPPVMLFTEEPTVLIMIDGEPRLVDTVESNVQRVMNTPYTLLLDKRQLTYYLYADKDSWYRAAELKGDWQPLERVPAGIARLAPEQQQVEEEEIDEEAQVGPPPKIIVATEPTELISSTGKPEYASIAGTSLLYVSNTDSDLLMDTDTQEHYVLLSGRWFVSKSLEGPWRYMAVEDLPGEFNKIPEDSELGTVLYAVPGTDVAREAVLDAQVPQTAAIEKAKASINIEYDGEPEFEKIDGTDMRWARNTVTPVIQVNQGYYAVDEAVWFTANNPNGPWAIALAVPDAIYTIPADSPVYNVTFVRIYGETDEVVYVGYTPGYTNTYVYNTTIVYGTGYYWPGWYGSYYYPRYSTWGYHVRWNPWTGFRFGLSYSTGPFTFYIGGGGWYRGGWWGPGHYRGYRYGYRHGYRHGVRRGYRAGYYAGRHSASRNNIYKSNRNQARVSNTSLVARNNARAGTAKNRTQAGGVASAVAGNRAQTGGSLGAAAAGRANNVYADKKGNVYRQTSSGWEQRTSDSWQSSRGSSQGREQTAQQRSNPGTQPRTRQQSPQSSQRFSQQQSQRSSYSSYGGSNDLNRSSWARQQGSQRSSSYRRSGGGGMRGGRR